jgi:D-alanyl-lipoteichoic acid acyltransferase DltB (MBOAT superfamily)
VATSFLSIEFFTFSIVSVFLLSVLGGSARQGVFLALNLFFVWLVVGSRGTLSTLAFCLLGYALIQSHVRRPDLKLFLTLPAFIALFAYMRNYEMLQWFLPDDVLTNALRTVGLSFILFRIIHVLIDARSGTLRELDFFTYLNYCLSFTTFMMGPIQRYQDYYDQWNGHTRAINPTFEAHLDAVLRILLGLVKAYVLAAWVNVLALKADTNILDLSTGGLVLRLYAFYFYLYLNFSGYCDIVIGIGSLFGVRPPENFNMPFIARNISDFWLRQHRSLTLWLTDYVFAPTYKAMLSGGPLSGAPVLAASLALFVTMLVSGLWHGTSVGFLLFGLAHGLYLVIYHVWDHWLVRKLGRRRTAAFRGTWAARAAGIFLTFNAAAFAFLFFRLDTPHLLQLLNGLFRS